MRWQGTLDHSTVVRINIPEPFALERDPLCV